MLARAIDMAGKKIGQQWRWLGGRQARQKSRQSEPALPASGRNGGGQGGGQSRVEGRAAGWAGRAADLAAAHNGSEIGSGRVGAHKIPSKTVQLYK